MSQHLEDRSRLEGEHRALAEAKEALDRELASERADQTTRATEYREKHRKLAEALRENILELHNSLSQEG